MKTTSTRLRLNLLSLLVLALSGCMSTQPLKPGRALTKPTGGGGLEQSITQAENPAQSSRQGQELTRLRTYTLPTGSEIQERVAQAQPTGSGVTNVQTITLSAPMPVVEREEIRAHTELGAAQKDTARELTAKLSSLKATVWVGLALVVFGLASLVWPPLQAVIGSLTTSAAIIFGGLALIVLPTLIVGNELLILGGVALGVGAWFLAHRHGQARGALAAQQTTEKSATNAN